MKELKKWAFTPEDLSDFWETMVIPEILVPGQIDRYEGHGTGEAGLFRAMIWQAVMDLRWTCFESVKTSTGKPRNVKADVRKSMAEQAKILQQETLEWVKSEENLPFSFEFICEGLGVPTVDVRAKILACFESWAATGGMIPKIRDQRTPGPTTHGLWVADKHRRSKNKRLTRTSIRGVKLKGIELRAN